MKSVEKLNRKKQLRDTTTIAIGKLMEYNKNGRRSPNSAGERLVRYHAKLKKTPRA